MIDIKLLRTDPWQIKKNCADKNISLDIDHIVSLDAQARALKQTIDELNAQRNQAASQRDIEWWKALKIKISDIESAYHTITNELNPLLLQIPNGYSTDTPHGKDESHNVVLRSWWDKKNFDFVPLEHRELAERRWLINFEAWSKVSGSRFAYLQWDLVKMQFALVQWIMDMLTNQATIDHIISHRKLDVSHRVFELVLPPVIMKMDVMQKMWRLEPKDERYCLHDDQQVLVWSAEHTLWPIHMDQTINDLPKRYLWYSTSFRREAWSYGRDVKGILRQHQFDKLEMESFTTAETGQSEQDFMVAIQEYILQLLWLPYQVVICCTWDMGAVDYRHIDIETWMPGQQKYRETHSADYMTDYQTRRLMTRYKTADWLAFVHTNDATALAIWRWLIAIIENYQQSDWTIIVPDVLKRRVWKDFI